MIIHDYNSLSLSNLILKVNVAACCDCTKENVEVIGDYLKARYELRIWSATFLVELTFLVLSPLCLELVKVATMPAKFMVSLA